MKQDQRKNTSKDLKPPKHGAGRTTILQMCAIALSAIVVYHIVNVRFLVPEAQATDESDGVGVSKIVAIDSKALLEAHIERMKKQIAGGDNFTEEQLNMNGANFGSELISTVNAYEKKGYIVLDTKHALGVPPEVDITATIAKKLSLKLEPSEDAFDVSKNAD